MRNNFRIMNLITEAIETAEESARILDSLGPARPGSGRRIGAHAPNLMWGTDGVRVFTVDDGWGWIFTAVEHWNAGPVCKRGDRFAALQPISVGLAGQVVTRAGGDFVAPGIDAKKAQNSRRRGRVPNHCAILIKAFDRGAGETYKRRSRRLARKGRHGALRFVSLTLRFAL